MADTYPPDRKGSTAHRGSKSSGRVADFRYRPSTQSGSRQPPASSGDGAGQPRPKNTPKNQQDARGQCSRATMPAARPNGASGKAAPFRSGQGGRRQAYAALDLGTNNCRLLIARPSGEDFTVIDAFSRVVRLGEDLAKTGRLSDDAMERTLGALQVCAEKLRKRNVHLARSVATEACRRASNGPAFIERVREQTGIALDIISAEEEARLAVLGCHVLLDADAGPAVIFDIGGGSTELVLVEPTGKVPRIIDWQSVPYGVVSLTDTVGRDEGSLEQRQARYAKMRQLVADSFAEFAERIAPYGERRDDIRLLGTSGTVTTLASLHLKLPHYDRRAVDGLIVPSRNMRAISADLSSKSPEERGAVPCIGKDRAELVVAGCAILESILDIWPSERLGVADRGIREGILRSLITAEADAERSLAALKKLRGHG